MGKGNITCQYPFEKTFISVTSRIFFPSSRCCTFCFIYFTFLFIFIHFNLDLVRYVAFSFLAPQLCMSWASSFRMHASISGRLWGSSRRVHSSTVMVLGRAFHLSRPHQTQPANPIEKKSCGSTYEGTTYVSCVCKSRAQI